MGGFCFSFRSLTTHQPFVLSLSKRGYSKGFLQGSENKLL
jgi:hypothetical protein